MYRVTLIVVMPSRYDVVFLTILFKRCRWNNQLKHVFTVVLMHSTNSICTVRFLLVSIRLVVYFLFVMFPDEALKCVYVHVGVCTIKFGTLFAIKYIVVLITQSCLIICLDVVS